jgi:hypothetical protein
MIAMGNALTAVIVLNGRVEGTWTKALTKDSVGIRLDPFRELNNNEREAVEAQVERYGRFFAIPAVIVGNLEPLKTSLSLEKDAHA